VGFIGAEVGRGLRGETAADVRSARRDSSTVVIGDAMQRAQSRGRGG
jgi:hypothetical protein